MIQEGAKIADGKAGWKKCCEDNPRSDHKNNNLCLEARRKAWAKTCNATYSPRGKSVLAMAGGSLVPDGTRSPEDVDDDRDADRKRERKVSRVKRASDS